MIKVRLLKDMKMVIESLGDPDCEVISPIFIDYNLIEVDAGHCWSIKDRPPSQTKKLASLCVDSAGMTHNKEGLNQILQRNSGKQLFQQRNSQGPRGLLKLAQPQ